MTSLKHEQERLELRATRARGLARQATEERQRLERMLADAKRKEVLACDEALKAEIAQHGGQEYL